MTSEKIKLRNLDNEVIKHFVSLNNKLTFDSLDESVVKEIKNGQGTYKYNDIELRSRIIDLEHTKLGSDQASKTYATISNTYTKAAVNDLISNCNTEISKRLNETTANNLYIKKENGAIAENYLSEDLINKINTRYELQRPPVTTGSGDISSSDLNLMNVQINNNKKSINDIQNRLNTEVLTVNDKIGRKYLDSAVLDVLDSARVKTVLIEMNDLSESIQKKLNNTVSGSFDTLENNINLNTEAIRQINEYFSLNNGETIFGARKDSNSDTSITLQHSMVLLENVTIIPTASLLNEAMHSIEADVLPGDEEDIRYLIDSENNILYKYSNSVWTHENENSQHFISASEFLAGRFALEYKTGNLYFGFSNEELDIVIDVSSFATKASLNDYARKTILNDYVTKQSANNTYSTIVALNSANSKITELQNKLTELTTSYTNLNNKVTSLESTITNLANRISALESKN